MADRRTDIENWAATEQDLRAALVGSVGVPPETSEQVAEYLDHNELGLAFETLVYELDRLSVSPSQETIERLRSAAGRMGGPEMEAEYREAWERVQLSSRP